MIIDILDQIECRYNFPHLRLINKYTLLHLSDKKVYDCKECGKYMLNYYSRKIKSFVNNKCGCIYCSKKEECNECGTYNFLTETSACCDYKCCYKYVCYNNCSYECDVCKKTFDCSDDVYIMATNKEDSEDQDEDQDEEDENDEDQDGEDENDEDQDEDHDENNENGDRKNTKKKFICNTCSVQKINMCTFRPNIWYGLSPDAYEEKYG